MQENGLIVADPKVMLGKPTLAGTRITVELILQKFAAGYSEEDILSAYPHLTSEGIRAALAFAAEAVDTSAIYPLDRAASQN